jgi:branched-chain amino acid transport system substrate-binding protein
MVGYENDYVGILRAARVLKPQVKAMVGVWSLATPKMASEFPDLMPNVYGTALLPFPANFTTEDGKNFSEAYKKMYNKEPDYLGQFGYVQSMLLFEAMRARPTRAPSRKTASRKKCARPTATR